MKILNPLKWVCGTANVIGLGILIVSFIVNGYKWNYTLSFIGLTMAISATLIFMVGLFFILTEELVSNTEKGEKVIPIKRNVSNVVEFKRKRRVSN
ncbi:hypothetical protein D1953_03200 [Peribacillus asahii]|uniref:Uncharacterized protein n=1 Tax=Peribacillus asahii TaxID=228899 RepID=A0A398BJS5_9BACI|nr:hypothetical protein [Peribacillus asahii]RID88738.1 hypothetical protein D1953_03200 [Peribacillus asahii]